MQINSNNKKTPSLKLTISILIANGVNLDLLGRREPEIYGDVTLDDIHRQLLIDAEIWQTGFALKKLDIHWFQSNHEAEYLNKLTEREWDGCLLNPGAWTHTSLALADRLKGLKIPFIELHLSNIFARESFRSTSYLSPLASGCISGLGIDSYRAGLFAILCKFKNNQISFDQKDLTNLPIF